jgi:hypothetical protein
MNCSLSDDKEVNYLCGPINAFTKSQTYAQSRVSLVEEFATPLHHLP